MQRQNTCSYALHIVIKIKEGLMPDDIDEKTGENVMDAFIAKYPKS